MHALSTRTSHTPFAHALLARTFVVFASSIFPCTHFHSPLQDPFADIFGVDMGATFDDEDDDAPSLLEALLVFYQKHAPNNASPSKVEAVLKKYTVRSLRIPLHPPHTHHAPFHPTPSPLCTQRHFAPLGP